MQYFYTKYGCNQYVFYKEITFYEREILIKFIFDLLLEHIKKSNIEIIGDYQ